MQILCGFFLLNTFSKWYDIVHSRNSTSEDLFGDGVDGQDLCSTTFNNSPGEAFIYGMSQNVQAPPNPQQRVPQKHASDDQEGKETTSKKQEK